jgi:hypothetical protein
VRLRATLAAGVLFVASAAACSSSTSKAQSKPTAPPECGSALGLSGNALPPQCTRPNTPDTGPGPRLFNANGVPDHWHAALGVNVCGRWQPGPIWPTVSMQTVARHDQPNVYAGLHTHQLMDGSSDGLIHMEPASRDEAGRNATLGRYMEFGGWRVSATALQLWPPVTSAAYDANGQPVAKGGAPIAVRNGEKCGAQRAVVRWAAGQFVPGKTTKLTEQHGDPSKLQLTDNQVIALYFVPSSTSLASLGTVPSIKNLPSAQP